MRDAVDASDATLDVDAAISTSTRHLALIVGLLQQHGAPFSCSDARAGYSTMT
jgi:hypothetical protein